jgi:hypothetical protein
MFANDAFLGAFLVAAGALVLFLLLREFWTWYWKQSQQLQVLKSIDRHLEQLLEQRGTAPYRPTAGAAVPPAAPAPKGWRDSLLDRIAGVP